MRILIISGVLFASITLAFFAPQRLTSLLLLFLVGLCIILILLRWPPIGIIGILVGGLFLPFSGPGGFNAAILGVAFMLGLWLLEMVVMRHKIQFAPSSTTIPLIVFTVSALLSFGTGQLHWYLFANQAPLDAQLGGLSIWILSAGAFILVGNQIKKLRWLETFTWVFLIVGGIFILSRLIPSIGRTVIPLFLNGINPGSAFWIFMMVIPLSQILFNQEMGPKWKIILSGLFIATLYVAMVQASGWKSGYIPPLAGIAIILGFRFKRFIWLLIPLGIVLSIYMLKQAISSDQYSYITRLEAWRIVLEISKVNPITGLGFANYYWYTPLFPILGWSVVFNSHSQYVDIIAQTGLLGLACFGWLFWSVGKLGWALKDRAPAGFARAYVVGALGGLVGTLVAGGFADWILPFVYNIGMNGFRVSVLAWIFLGGLVSIEQIVKNQSALQNSG